jgi:hypothetical protein
MNTPLEFVGGNNYLFSEAGRLIEETRFLTIEPAQGDPHAALLIYGTARFSLELDKFAFLGR